MNTVVAGCTGLFAGCVMQVSSRRMAGAEQGPGEILMRGPLRMAMGRRLRTLCERWSPSCADRTAGASVDGGAWAARFHRGACRVA